LAIIFIYFIYSYTYYY